MDSPVLPSLATGPTREQEHGEQSEKFRFTSLGIISDP